MELKYSNDSKGAPVNTDNGPKNAWSFLVKYLTEHQLDYISREAFQNILRAMDEYSFLRARDALKVVSDTVILDLEDKDLIQEMIRSDSNIER